MEEITKKGKTKDVRDIVNIFSEFSNIWIFSNEYEFTKAYHTEQIVLCIKDHSRSKRKLWFYCEILFGKDRKISVHARPDTEEELNFTKSIIARVYDEILG